MQYYSVLIEEERNNKNAQTTQSATYCVKKQGSIRAFRISSFSATGTERNRKSAKLCKNILRLTLISQKVLDSEL